MTVLTEHESIDSPEENLLENDTSEENLLENDNNHVVEYCCCNFYPCKNMWLDCFNCSFKDPCCYCCEENLNVTGPKSNHQYCNCYYGRNERYNYCFDLIPFIPICVAFLPIVVLLTIIVSIVALVIILTMIIIGLPFLIVYCFLTLILNINLLTDRTKNNILYFWYFMGILVTISIITDFVLISSIMLYIILTF
jgi:hypothetical protein